MVKNLFLAAFAAVALLLSGCVYLRLLELKHQLADFDKYFDADIRDGLKLTCKKPVLLDEDMGFFQLVPESKERIGVAERWHFGWTKDYAVPGEEPAAFGVSADFTFVDHKLARVVLPERFFAFMPKSLFMGLIRSMGHAQIDEKNRSASSNYHEEPGAAGATPIPTETEITAMLGAPMAASHTIVGDFWRYRYAKASPDQKSGRIDVTFIFHPETKKLRHIKGRVFDATLNFDLDDTPAPPKTPSP